MDSTFSRFKTIHFVLSLSLVLSLTCVASTAHGQQGPSVDAVARALNGCVTSTKSTFSTYHWETTEFDKQAAKNLNQKSLDVKTPEGKLAYIKSLAKDFVDSDARGGLYMASDPFLSASFGFLNSKYEATRDPYRLIAIDIEQGTKFLDLSRCSADEKLKELFPQDSKCPYAIGVYGDQPSGAGADESCKKLKNEVFTKLGVAGVKYPWRSTELYGIEFCKERDNGAFIITNPEVIKPGNFRLYSSSSTPTPETQDEMEATQTLLNLYGERVMDSFKYTSLWSGVYKKVHATKPLKMNEKTEQWMKKNLMNCQAVPGSSNDRSEMSPKRTAN